MPLHESGHLAQHVFDAVVVIPAYNGEQSIQQTLSSVAASICADPRQRRVAISITDDASSDATTNRIRDFADTSDIPVYLQVHRENAGRAAARNRSVTAVTARLLFFLDQDDDYFPEHIPNCLDAMEAHPRIDYIKTAVALSDPVHSDWEMPIARSLTQNLCVRSYCHRLVGGFQEEPEVQAYGCDDVLFNRLIEYFFRGLELPEKTVTYCRRKGNSFDQQYFGKFSKPISEANSVLKLHQSRLQGVIEALHTQRTREVAQRIQNSAVLGRLRPYPAHLR